MVISMSKIARGFALNASALIGLFLTEEISHPQVVHLATSSGFLCPHVAQ